MTIAGKHNFSPGPSVLPTEVLLKAQAEFLNYNGSGMSVMEMSHRSKSFETILETAQKNLCSLLEIPSNYKILFLQGGASSVFSAIYYNFGGGHKPLDYIVTGVWSDKAAKEAQLLGGNVNIVINTKESKHTGYLPPQSEWKLSGKNAGYVYYCDNETVHGVEFPYIPNVPEGVPLICDMSSNILSRRFDVNRFGAIFAGAQKNLGPAGVTLVIVREDLINLNRTSPKVPIPAMLDFKIAADNNSLYNTPPTYAIYVTGLVLEWLLENGGIQITEANAKNKSSKVYQIIDASHGFYSGPVNPSFRSRMNIPFRITKNGIPDPDLESEFLKGAESRGMIQLAGHRSVGGIRASLYNALPMESVQVLIDYMEEFVRHH